MQVNILGLLFSSDTKITQFNKTLYLDVINHTDDLHHINDIHHIDKNHHINESHHKDEIHCLDKIHHLVQILLWGYPFFGEIQDFDEIYLNLGFNHLNNWGQTLGIDIWIRGLGFVLMMKLKYVLLMQSSLVFHYALLIVVWLLD